MILEEIASYTKVRVERDKKSIPLSEMKKTALEMPKGNFRFASQLRAQFPGLICEVKKASPSKGVISPDFPYLEIAKEYQASGATCISVLTEPKWFLGSDEIFSQIREAVTLPMIRKDFTIDEYQIYQAKVLGADCVLLICALLDTETIRNYLEICNTLGMSALVEAHDAKEVESAINAGAQIIGVNNRNLKDFTVNFQNATDLVSHIPDDILYVAESGVSTVEDGISLINAGSDALLIGEALMKSEDKGLFIQRIKEHPYDRS